MEKQNLPHDHHSAMEKDFDHMPAPEAFEVTADLFKLMSDLTRVRLFWLLCHCEECVLNLSVMMNMSSPALSHHLKLLKACGLIVSRRERRGQRPGQCPAPCHRACGGNRLPGMISL